MKNYAEIPLVERLGIDTRTGAPVLCSLCKSCISVSVSVDGNNCNLAGCSLYEKSAGGWVSVAETGECEGFGKKGEQ